MREIVLHLLTCPARAAECARVVAALAEGAWPEAPRIHVSDDPGDAEENAILRGHSAVLEQALAGPGTHFLVLEDDLCVNRHLHENLARWALWTHAAAVDFATFYNPGLRPLSPPPMPHAADAATYFAAEPHSVVGGQARLFSRRCARLLVERARGPGLRQDMRFARSAAEAFGPLWVHRPSLIDHAAAPSTWAGPTHRAADFDAEWRADESLSRNSPAGS